MRFNTIYAPLLIFYTKKPNSIRSNGFISFCLRSEIARDFNQFQASTHKYFGKRRKLRATPCFRAELRKLPAFFVETRSVHVVQSRSARDAIGAGRPPMTGERHRHFPYTVALWQAMLRSRYSFSTQTELALQHYRATLKRSDVRLTLLASCRVACDGKEFVSLFELATNRGFTIARFKLILLHLIGVVLADIARGGGVMCCC